MSQKIVCYCMNVTEEEIVTAIANGAQSLSDIMKATQACTGSMCAEMNPEKRCCSLDIEALLTRGKSSRGTSGT